MTTQHMYQGLTMAMRTTRLSNRLGIDPKVVSAMKHGTQREIKASTLDLIHHHTGVSLDQLMAWYRLPEGAPVEPYKPRLTAPLSLHPNDLEAVVQGVVNALSERMACSR